MSETSPAWHSGPLLGFDTETTGVTPTRDRIVAAALVDSAPAGSVLEPAAVAATTWLVDPGVDIPPEAQAIHGISTEYAREHGRPPAEALTEIAERLTAAAQEHIPVVVYRAGFDMTLLASELDRHGIPQPQWDELAIIDPFVLDKRADRYRRGKRTLSAVCEHYGVTLDDAHSAAADATAAVQLARALGASHRILSELSAIELHRNQIGWHAEDAASLERYLHRRGRPETVDRRWPLQV